MKIKIIAVFLTCFLTVVASIFPPGNASSQEVKPLPVNVAKSDTIIPISSSLDSLTEIAVDKAGAFKELATKNRKSVELVFEKSKKKLANQKNKTIDTVILIRIDGKDSVRKVSDTTYKKIENTDDRGFLKKILGIDKPKK